MTQVFPNYIREYYEKIKSGEIVVGKRIRQQYEILIDDLDNPKEPYVFDIKRGTYPIVWIEAFCKQAQGKNMGKPLKLELFQKAKMQATFGFVHEETRMRQYREVMTIEGRKNGKTTENSALALFMLLGDLEGSAECYFVATKKDQANKGFDESYKMVQQSPELRKRIRKTQSGLNYAKTYSNLQALASESNSLDGLNSHFVTVDELAAIKDRNLYDVMKQSTSSRDQALVSSISTNGFVREGIYDNQYEYACNVLDRKEGFDDRRFLAFLYELDKGDDWQDESVWMKANPGLGPIKKIEELRAFVNKAKVSAADRPTVMTKDFNMISTGSTAWLPYEVLNNEATFDLKDMGFRYGIGGFDMSETTDLTAATVLMRRPDDDTLYVKSMFWLPSNTIEKRADEDKIPYDLFERQGILRASGEYKIDMRDVLKWFVEVQTVDDVYIQKIGYDPWHVEDALLEDFNGHFGKRSMIPVRQGPTTLSAPMKELEADLGAKVINYNNNSLVKMCLANTEIKVDTNANIAPVKGRDPRKRIDGTVALLCAYVAYRDNKNDYLNLI